MDFTDYQPAAPVLGHLQGVAFVAVAGPTAAGKTTLMENSAARDSRLTMVLTTTSRPPRPGERDGVDIHFRSKEAMLARIAKREYVQVALSPLGDIYATAPEDYPIEGLATLPVFTTALQKFRGLPFKRFTTVYVVPPDGQSWQERIKGHGFSPDERAKRLGEAKRSMIYALQDKTLQLVISGSKVQATVDFMTIITQQPLNNRQQQDQVRAKQIIEELLKKL